MVWIQAFNSLLVSTQMCVT